MSKREQSIVEYFAEHEGYRCGYCGSSDTNCSHGMWAHSMTVQDYQDLIDRGWRRSGKYCYKPTMKQTCCPQYTIRCEALNFKLSNSHKKVIKRVNRFLISGQRSGEKPNAEKDGPGGVVTGGPGGDNFIIALKTELSLTPSDIKRYRKAGDDKAKPQAKELKTPAGACIKDLGNRDAAFTEAQVNMRQVKKNKKNPPKPGSGADPNKPPCQKAKTLRMMKKGQGKEAIKGQVQNKNIAKTLEDYLNEPLKAEKVAHHLEIKLIRSFPKSPEFQASFKQSHTVYHKYQTTIHKDPPDKPNEQQYSRFLVESPLEVKIVRTSPQSDAYRFSFSDSYDLYKRYQMTIHKEAPSECSKYGYCEFLVESPLESQVPESGEGGLPYGYGSFHQHYILDGKIIAVGVVDILPKCLSSVYLYYDPDYSFLSLGTYSALRELAFVREMQHFAPELKYYYMGFYIHSCPKMRYKGQYYPSKLLCPEAYTWVPIEKCIPKLKISRYSRLEEEGIEDADGNIDIDRVLVLHEGTAMPFEVYQSLKSTCRDKSSILEYATLVGQTCAQRMLLYRK